jgi:hypothetical protein
VCKRKHTSLCVGWVRGWIEAGSFVIDTLKAIGGKKTSLGYRQEPYSLLHSLSMQEFNKHGKRPSKPGWWLWHPSAAWSLCPSLTAEWQSEQAGARVALHVTPVFWKVTEVSMFSKLTAI